MLVVKAEHPLIAFFGNSGMNVMIGPSKRNITIQHGFKIQEAIEQ